MLTQDDLEQLRKVLRKELALIDKSLRAIHKEMATKSDIKKLNKTIQIYSELIRIYITQQEILRERMEAIEQYLGFTDN